MDNSIISLIILAVVLVLFITRVVPNAVAAIIGCVLFVLFNICSIKEAFSGFSNSIVLLMTGMMIVGIGMNDTGIAKIIGRTVSIVSKHNERLFILIAGTVSALLSTFLSNTAVIAIFLPIISSISQNDNKMNKMNLTLPITFGAMFGGVCTLVGSTPQLTANGILTEMTGKSIGMFDYTLPGTIVFIVYMVYSLFIGYPLGEKIWGDRKRTVDNPVTDNNIKQYQNKNSKYKIIMMSVIFITTIVLFIGGWLDTAIVAVIAAILCIITKCTSIKSVLKGMDWSVIFVLAGCLGIATGITKGGAANLIGDFLSGSLGKGMHPQIIYAIFIILTMLISNFITNSTAVIITLPVAISLCETIGLNSILFTMGIVFSANLAYSTPLANAQTAMTLVAGYKFSDYIRYTWILDILVLTVIIFIFPLLMPLYN